MSWAQATAGVAALIDGDLNFMNLETVVTDDNRLTPASKRLRVPYHFRSHPQGVRHLVRTGFNLISLANNHAFDYGEAGLRDTLTHMAALESDGLLGYAGAGLDEAEAARPVLVRAGKAQVGFSAIGIVTRRDKRHRAGAHRAGTLAYRLGNDFEVATGALARLPADYRILSIHYGREYHVRTQSRQLREWRWAVRERDVDLVVGHHAHVARGVERYRGGLIFYGLGNFLHPGLMNQSRPERLRLCRDFGLLARVHLRRDAAGKLALRAIEVVPVRDMHRKPSPYPEAEGRARVHVMNYHAARLDDAEAGAAGVRFAPRADGSGIYCEPGAESDPGRVGEMCRGLAKPVAPSREVRRRIRHACSSKRASSR
jgi:poly-gamma-glutamate synthesis protein (capsule biosynthesis protein)